MVCKRKLIIRLIFTIRMNNHSYFFIFRYLICILPHTLLLLIFSAFKTDFLSFILQFVLPVFFSALSIHVPFDRTVIQIIEIHHNNTCDICNNRKNNKCK